LTHSDLQFLSVGEGAKSRRLAYRLRPGRGPAIVWLGGFRSDMASTKAAALDQWGADANRAVLRFDYSGHGESGGRFEDATLSQWLEDSLAVIDALVRDPPVLVGSSMGGWIALLAARVLAQRQPARRVAGLVLIAPAVDFTQELMWQAFPPEVQQQIETQGVWLRPNAYGDEPYPITRALIEDGRQHLLLDGPIRSFAPVHVLQGMDDPDVPWQHAMRLIAHLPGDETMITLIKDGDHRLSRPQDIDRLLEAVATICPVAAREAPS
jgi:pimeloyl-ACP methyl ester carboxylesterase